MRKIETIDIEQNTREEAAQLVANFCDVSPYTGLLVVEEIITIINAQLSAEGKLMQLRCNSQQSNG